MRQSAISSASLRASWMLCTVASMLTTTPRFSPLLGVTPKPASLRVPPGCSSATTTMILAVPISNPTTMSLYSLAMVVFVCLPFRGSSGFVGQGGHAFEAHRVPIGVTHVNQLQSLRVAGGDLADGLRQQLGAPCDGGAVAAAQLHHGAVVQAHPPTAPVVQFQALDVKVQALKHRAQLAVGVEHLRRLALGPSQFAPPIGLGVVGVGLKHLAL